ncbi:MAG: YraN family protein [Candidatus Hydrogenedentes bacterium]|nr:YraN family protein [Candidatus Hydrogenedentota bacterium]
MKRFISKFFSYFRVLGKGKNLFSDSSTPLDLGKAGELEAERYLTRAGLHIIERNKRLGNLEIDLVAQDENEIVFVEVKTRRNNRWGFPESNVDYKKQRALKRAGKYYFLKNCSPTQTYRFDIVAITLEPEVSIEWIKNAF